LVIAAGFGWIGAIVGKWLGDLVEKSIAKGIKTATQTRHAAKHSNEVTKGATMVAYTKRPWWQAVNGTHALTTTGVSASSVIFGKYWVELKGLFPDFMQNMFGISKPGTLQKRTQAQREAVKPNVPKQMTPMELGDDLEINPEGGPIDINDVPEDPNPAPEMKVESHIPKKEGY
jgi:hypothetical protein